ncbi:hypothetical protein QR680_017994 [Steinernema hermaphroditum]|uniref:Saposin B-type domain-containing protein n=1 Tax=Steinernema hermaphroditum TaxID=289476 RepID=A0AA39LPP0_9BILA|nr:hypothetical protein QR680_017994 [Steinernema hermaphroditum]
MKLLAALLLVCCLTASSNATSNFCNFCLRLIKEVQVGAHRFSKKETLIQKAEGICEKFGQEIDALGGESTLVEVPCITMFVNKFDTMAYEIRTHADPMMVCQKIRIC